jgi:murein L,D-transpeptidase YcbB/YkuD
MTIRVSHRWWLGVALALVVHAPLIAQPSKARDTLRARAIGLQSGTRVRGAALRHPEVVRSFFAGRRFQPAWPLPGAAEAMVRAIREIEADGLTPADYHLATIERTLAARSRQPSPALDADLQVLIADAAAALVDHVRYGKVRPSALDRRWNVDPRAGAPPLRSVLDGLAKSPALDQSIEALKPSHFIYTGLKKDLARMRAIAARGGWGTVPDGPSLEPGAHDSRVPAIRRRLVASGELPRTASLDDDHYDREVEEAMTVFQDRHRLSPDAVVGKGTLLAMNITAETRIAQLRANLERARWILGSLRQPVLLVNLPAFEAYFMRGGSPVWESRVQVGEEGRASPSFRANLQYLVFNPDWTVPPTILQKDIIEGMRKGEKPDPIEKRGLIPLDQNGRPLDPRVLRQINWRTVTSGTFPYRLRQPPGPNNALGSVKFMLPNPYTVYLHDTPYWELFVTNQRTFSSGCIRVEHALELAALVLKENGWTPARVQATVNTRKTQIVQLRKPLPVILMYMTATGMPSGEARFTEDIYGLDMIVARALGGVNMKTLPQRVPATTMQTSR